MVVVELFFPWQSERERQRERQIAHLELIIRIYIHIHLHKRHESRTRDAYNALRTKENEGRKEGRTKRTDGRDKTQTDNKRRFTSLADYTTSHLLALNHNRVAHSFALRVRASFASESGRSAVRCSCLREYRHCFFFLFPSLRPSATFVCVCLCLSLPSERSPLFLLSR